MYRTRFISKRGINHFFGSGSNLREIAYRKPSIYNSWASFLRQMNSTPREVRRTWRVTRASTKDAIRGSIASENKEDKHQRELDMHRVLNSSIVGPFAGYEHDVPIGACEVHDALHAPSSELAENLKEHGIRSHKADLDAQRPLYRPSVDTVDSAENVLLEFESCSSCKKKRTDTLGRFAPLRDLLKGHCFTDI